MVINGRRWPPKQVLALVTGLGNRRMPLITSPTRDVSRRGRLRGIRLTSSRPLGTASRRIVARTWVHAACCAGGWMPRSIVEISDASSAAMLTFGTWNRCDAETA